MNIMGKIKIWFAVSFITLIAGIMALFVYKLNIGIDFTGGSLLEISTSETVNKEKIEQIYKDEKIEYTTISSSGQESIIIRSKEINEDKKNDIINTINNKIGESEKVGEERFETIGPTVSSDLVRKAIISVILASLGIIFYIAFAFRKMSDRGLSWRFGICAIIALIHDLFIAAGLFALFGHIFGWEIDSLFITALLTVMGFSVHDTIVVFDRLRENLKKYSGDPFVDIANASLVQTFTRSINTSFTILLTLAALLFLGGNSIKPFVFTLFVGILVGTYSSIFIATPTVVIWQNIIDKKPGSRK